MKSYTRALIAGLIAITTAPVVAEPVEIQPGSPTEDALVDRIYQKQGAQLPCYSNMDLTVAPPVAGAATVVVTVVMDTSCRTDDNGNLSDKSTSNATVYVFDYGNIGQMHYNRQLPKLILSEAYAKAGVGLDGMVTLQYLMPASGVEYAFFEPIIVYADENLKNGVVSRSWMGPSSHADDVVRQAHGGVKGPGSQGGHFATLFAFADGKQVRITPEMAMRACLTTPSNDDSPNYYDRCAVEKQMQYWAVSANTPQSGPEDMQGYAAMDAADIEAQKLRDNQ